MGPGHEILGRVSAFGAEITKFKVGDIGGVGCMVDSCGTWDNCRADIEIIGPDGISKAYDRVVAKDVRNRFVIDIAKAAA